MAPATDVLPLKIASICPFELTDEERTALGSVPMQAAELAANEDVVRERDRPSRSFVLLDGFLATYKVTSDGKQQTLSFHVVGDMPDLQSLHLGALDNTVGTLTACKLGFIAHDALRELCRAHPRLAHVLWRSSLIDGAIYREWLLNIGRREAYARMAHLFCEFTVRLDVVGRVKDRGCALPIKQAHIADAMGLSPVHVNRTMQALRGDGLLAWERGRLTVLDWAGLKRAGQFDPAYLHLSGPAYAG